MEEKTLFSYNRASELMDEAGIDLLMVNTKTNVSYLTDYYSHFMNEDFFLDDGSAQYISFAGLPKDKAKEAFFTPNSQDGEDLITRKIWIKDLRFYGSYADYSNLRQADDKSWEIRHDNIVGCVVEAIKDRELDKRTIGIEMTRIPASIFLSLTESLPDAKFVDGTEVLRQMRIIKTYEEIKRIESATKFSDLALQKAFSNISEGMSEIECEKILKSSILESGGDFKWDHVAFGPRSISLPTDRKINSGETARIDFGGSYRGYICDTCRTKVLGKPSKEQIKIYKAVLNTLGAVKKEISPGVKCSVLYKAGSAMMKKHGFRLFLPTVGHGVGRDIHEIPFLTENNTAILKPGMVFSVEIYLVNDDWTVAIDLEDQVAVTDSGYRDFNFVDLNMGLI